MPREGDGDGDRPKNERPKGKVLDFVHKRTYSWVPKGKYEWNREKARINRRKHGVDFADAALVLEDPLGLTMPDPFATGEDRRLALGCDAQGRLLVVAFVWRGKAARLISAREATAIERRRYEEVP